MAIDNRHFVITLCVHHIADKSPYSAVARINRLRRDKTWTYSCIISNFLQFSRYSYFRAIGGHDNSLALDGRRPTGVGCDLLSCGVSLGKVPHALPRQVIVGSNLLARATPKRHTHEVKDLRGMRVQVFFSFIRLSADADDHGRAPVCCRKDRRCTEDSLDF